MSQPGGGETTELGDASMFGRKVDNVHENRSIYKVKRICFGREYARSG